MAAISQPWDRLSEPGPAVRDRPARCSHEFAKPSLARHAVTVQNQDLLVQRHLLHQHEFASCPAEDRNRTGTACPRCRDFVSPAVGCARWSATEAHVGHATPAGRRSRARAVLAARSRRAPRGTAPRSPQCVPPTLGHETCLHRARSRSARSSAREAPGPLPIPGRVAVAQARRRGLPADGRAAPCRSLGPASDRATMARADTSPATKTPDRYVS